MNLLWGFNFTPALDENGNEIKPDAHIIRASRLLKLLIRMLELHMGSGGVPLEKIELPTCMRPALGLKGVPTSISDVIAFTACAHGRYRTRS